MISAFGVVHSDDISKKSFAPLLKKPKLAAALHRKNAQRYLDKEPGAAMWEAKYAGAKLANVSKRKEVSDAIRPILPSTTTDAYDKSAYRKKKAAKQNLAARAIGSAAGFGGAYIGYRATKGKIKFLNKDTRIPIPGKKVPVFLSAEKKQGAAASAVTGVGSAAVGYAASRKSLDNIKKDPQYRYRKN